MSATQDLKNAIFLLSSRSRELGTYRNGDIVFYATDPEGDEVPQAGYAILANSSHYYAFDPYDENATPKAALLPEEVSLRYHGSVPLDPRVLSLEDTLALLWKAHREALSEAGEQLLQTDAEDFEPGEIVLQDRLDGRLSLNIHGQEAGYGAAPTKRRFLFWKAKVPLITRPFTECHLLRPLSSASVGRPSMGEVI